MGGPATMRVLLLIFLPCWVLSKGNITVLRTGTDIAKFNHTLGVELLNSDVSKLEESVINISIRHANDFF